jgi:catechol 2,3-dioxygenase-like lactoylglutathione lyase family enzyme
MPASIRYVVDDATSARDFYRDQLGFAVDLDATPDFVVLRRDDLRLLVNRVGGAGGAGQTLSDGRRPEPGGWNRIQLEVDDVDAEVARLAAAGVAVRGAVVHGRGGDQALVDDPAGNPIELFHPHPR